MGRIRTVAALAVAGGLVFAAGRALRRHYHADSLSAALQGAAAEFGELAAAVRHGMTEREGELRVALGLDVPPAGTRLDPEAVRTLLDDPAGPSARPT